MKILAIIPARGGSKGVPRKNIRLLGGKPLIAYTIIEALKTKEIDRVVVSTDDKEIAQISRKYGAEVPFLRLGELAQDTVPIEPVLKDAVDYLEKNEGYKPDIVVLLQPTSPLRRAEQIKKAIERFIEKECDTLITVDEKRDYFYKIEDSGVAIPLYRERKRRQERKAVFVENGSIYVVKSSLVKEGKIFGEKIGYLITDSISSIDIDEYLDFEIAEKYLKKAKKRKICIISGTRADFGKLLPIMEEIRADRELDLSIIATGMHLLDEFGYTIEEIEKEGFSVDVPVKAILSGDDGLTMVKSLALAIQGLSQAVRGIKPDIILINGDRSEALAGALVGAYSNIPVAHIEGGEVSGTIDESIRHAITKFSHIHFASNRDNAERILKLGERKKHIFVVGSPDLDVVVSKELPDQREVEKELDIELVKPTIVVLQHPVTTEVEQARQQMKETLDALCDLKLQTVLIYPNADAGSRKMIETIEEYKKKYPWLKTFKNLNFKLYLALLKYAAVLIGNSSSGIRQAPSFKLPVVNIGSRQNGRQQANNVINVDHESKKIARAIKEAQSPGFKEKVRNCINPYGGDGKTAERIVKILKSLPLNKELIQKQLTY